MQWKTVPVKIKTTGEDPSTGEELKEGEFLVYPSTFTRQPDAYGDVVLKGAFADDIQYWKNPGVQMPGLFGHQMGDPDYFVAYAIDMGEDDHGWWVKGAFDFDIPKAATTYKLVKAGRITQLSFAFDVLDEGQVELEDGRKANELRQLKVYEFSFVPIGANQDTSVVAVKAATDALTHRAKTGLANGDVDQLKEASAALAAAKASIDDFLAALGGDPDTVEASGQAVVKSEEPDGAKDEGEGVNPSAETLSLLIDIQALA